MKITRNSEKVYYDFLPSMEPRVSIASGDRVMVETFDAAGGMFLEGWEYVRPNPATGPIYVNEALPGDTLEVEIHDIKLFGSGYMHIPHAREGISTEFTRNGHEFIKAEAMADGSLSVVNNDGKILPANPMIGVIAVAVSPDATGEYPSVDAGDHGGNMDNSLIVPGVKVYLPVFTDGALLGIGDVHGAMGDGEIFDQGMEMCADVDVTIKVRKDVKVKRPFVVSDELIATTATTATLEESCALAVADMRDILETYYDLSHEDAGLLVGFYGDLKFCQVINKTVRLEIKKTYLAQFASAVDQPF